MQASNSHVRPLCLIVIDGWGVGGEGPGNAISLANTPNMKHLQTSSLCTELCAHGLRVGLPRGLMGNSEVGHLNIGAGRVVYQDIVRIDEMIRKGLLESNPAVCEFASKQRLHLIGLVSDGGVHSHIDHLKALVKACTLLNPTAQIYIHAITDGRDTDPKSALKYIQQLLDFIKKEGYLKVHLATIVGRYWAMDRDKRWERTRIAETALFLEHQEEQQLKNISSSSIDDKLTTVLAAKYAQGETDEFWKPVIVDQAGRIRDSPPSMFSFHFIFSLSLTS